MVLGLNKHLDDPENKPVNMYCYKILGAECSDSDIKFKIENNEEYNNLLVPLPPEEEPKEKDVIADAKKRGLTFTEEDFKKNSGLKVRIIKMLHATKKEDIDDFSEEKKNRIQKALTQKKKKNKKKEEQKKKKKLAKKLIYLFIIKLLNRIVNK